MIQGGNDERESACEARPQEGIGRHGGSGVLRKSVDEVVEGGLEDCEEARSQEYEAYARYDPVVVRGRGPAH